MDNKQSYYQRNREKVLKKRRVRYQSDMASGKRRNAELQRTFGISLGEYDQMFAAQKGLCAICGRPETAKRNGVVKRLAVDHDHKTGRIRGLLCGRCNPMIGYAQDDPEILTVAAMYLRRDPNGKEREPTLG